MSRFALGLVCLLGCWASPRPAAPPRDIHIALAVEQVELSNGLKLVVVPEPTAVEVSVTVRYAVGSVDDPLGREGLAHLVEHLMFEHVRDGEALFDFLERSGLGFTGFTTLDGTIYNERGSPSQLKELLAVEQARLQQQCDAIPESSFARQREIVRNELREREGDARVAHALHAGAFSTSHPFGRAPGTAQSVATITRQDACEFVATHYAPNNAVVVVSGPVKQQDVQRLVEETLGTVPRGNVKPRVVPVLSGRRSVTLDAPTDRPWFVLVWPLPVSSADRIRLRAVASMATGLISARINGVVTATELGAGGVRAIAIAVAPSSEISFRDALANAKGVIADMAPWFASGLYEHAKNRATFGLAASLDHGLDRDMRFADEVARGRQVRPGDEVRALASMSRDEANKLVRTLLHPDKATVVTLRNSTPTASTGDIAPTFREHRRRRAEDPSEAHRPAATVATTDPFQRARSRTLPNGMAVVLLPLSTMPIVDIRLVLPTGTRDEAEKQRGIAVVAAHAIEPAFDADMFRFAQSGGRVDADVGFDATAFAVAGLAANLDILLAGLAATVREGSYTTDGVRAEVAWQQLTTKTSREDQIATAVWRDAIYGADHPYRHAGQWAHASRGYELTTLEGFRSQHYRPGRATLIISGGFDIAVAERWVDHYFKDWTGEPAIRRHREASLRPLAFAQKQQSPLISVQIAFPAPTNDEAALQVLVEMVEGAIADVREQLAASYGLRASSDVRRSSATLVVQGSIDAARAGEAFALLRNRLAALRERSDATASLFVSARRRVLANLASIDTRATAIANRSSDRVASGRSADVGPSIDRATLLTIETIAPLFEKLDLSNAAILLRGPESALRAAYASIGRQPSYID